MKVTGILLVIVNGFVAVQEIAKENFLKALPAAAVALAIGYCLKKKYY
jgi:hypothetical protein